MWVFITQFSQVIKIVHDILDTGTISEKNKTLDVTMRLAESVARSLSTCRARQQQR